MTKEEKYLELSLMTKKIQFIKDVVSLYYKKPISDYDIKTRRRDVVKLKYVTIYLALRKTSISLVDLGVIFGYNHATVIHANKQIIGYLTFDKELKNEINEVQALIDHKITIIEGKLNLEDDYSYINLNECVGVNLIGGKGIVFSGIPQEKIDEVLACLELNENSSRQTVFTNTGMYLFKKIDKNEKK